MVVFYVETVSEKIAECIVSIAKKNSYTFGDCDEQFRTHNLWLGFYPEFKNGPELHFHCYKPPEPILHGINDFAEIIRWLENPCMTKKITIGKYEGEISADGQKLKLTCYRGRDSEEFAICPHIELTFGELIKICDKMNKMPKKLSISK